MVSKMTRKKILITSNPMNCGGIEKSLLAVLQLMDYEKYDVYFMPYRKGGEWNEMIPKEVNILEAPEYLERVMLYRDQLSYQIKKNILRPSVIIPYLRAIIQGKAIHNMDVARQRYWDKTADKYPRVPGDFDYAIDFRSEIGCYFCIDKVNATHKIGWYHGVYSNYQRDKEIDRKYWDQLDHMVFVSKAGAEDMRKTFPDISPAFHVLRNILNGKCLTQLSDLEPSPFDSGKVKILSVGRLNQGKNYTLAIETAVYLRNNKIDFQWLIVGDGPDRELLDKKIVDNNLSDCVKLVGEKDNPYPYFKDADYFVHTSLMEGSPIVLDEAMYFDCIPVVTNYPTAKNQIENGVNGLIVDFDPKVIAESIEELIRDKEKARNLRGNIKRTDYDNSDEIKTLFDILDKE